MKKSWLIVPAVSIPSFMALGLPFFNLIVNAKKKQINAGKKKPGKKHQWFTLKHTQINHPRHKFEKEYEAGKAWCMDRTMQDCYIKSTDGLTLHAYFFPAKHAKRYLILCHGYRGTGFGDFAYMIKFLHENNCHLLIIDERCCGKSEGNYITFGAKEQYDIVRWTEYLSRRNYAGLPVYLYGESMGAASALMASGHPLPENVKGIIADCGFHSMKSQLRDIASEWFHLDWIELLLFRVDLFCRIFGKFRMRDADTTEALKKNKRPVLFFHGMKDTYVKPENSKRNYALCRAPKELILFKNARHLCSPYEKTELYRKKILQFFQKYDG